MAQLRVRAVGDLALYRLVPAAMQRIGVAEFCREAREDLAPGDLRFANLEVPLAEHPHNDEFALCGPLAMARVVSELGLNVVSVANNHIMDAGVDAFRQTLAAMRKQGVRTVGGGMTLDEARRPLVLDLAGQRVGVLAYAEGQARLHHHIATADRPGVAPIERELILEDIARLRLRVDVVILALHWGVNYIPFAMPEQRALARDLLAAGVALILGAHPHVLQGAEHSGRGLVAYSLGDFIGDPGGGNVVKPERVVQRRETAVLDVVLQDGAVAGRRWIPYRSDTDYRPRRLADEDAQRALERLAALDDRYAGDRYPRDPWAAAGGEIGGHALQVLLFHLKRGNFGYLLRRIRRIRPRHLAMARGLLSRTRAKSRRPEKT